MGGQVQGFLSLVIIGANLLLADSALRESDLGNKSIIDLGPLMEAYADCSAYVVTFSRKGPYIGPLPVPSFLLDGDWADRPRPRRAQEGGPYKTTVGRRRSPLCGVAFLLFPELAGPVSAWGTMYVKWTWTSLSESSSLLGKYVKMEISDTVVFSRELSGMPKAVHLGVRSFDHIMRLSRIVVYEVAVSSDGGHFEVRSGSLVDQFPCGVRTVSLDLGLQPSRRRRHIEDVHAGLTRQGSLLRLNTHGLCYAGADDRLNNSFDPSVITRNPFRIGKKNQELDWRTSPTLFKNSSSRLDFDPMVYVCALMMESVAVESDVPIDPAHVPAVEDLASLLIFRTCRGTNMLLGLTAFYGEMDAFGWINFGIGSLVILETQYMTFLTCDGVEAALSFSLYVRPYDGRSWAYVIIFALILLPVLTLVSFVVVSRDTATLWELLDLFFQTIMLYLGVLVEQVGSVAGALRRIPILVLSTNLVLGLWVLMSVVLVNAYKGLVVTDLTAPLRLSQRWYSLSELQHFLIMAPNAAVNVLLDSVDIFGWEKTPEPESLYDCYCSEAYGSSLACRAPRFGRDNQSVRLSDCRNHLKGMSEDGFRLPDLSKSVCQVNEYRCQPWFRLQSGPNPEYFQGMYKRYRAVKFGTILVSTLGRGQPGETELTRRNDTIELMRTCRRTAYLSYDSVLDGFIAAERLAGSTKAYKKGEKGQISFWVSIKLQNVLPSGIHKRLQLLLGSGIAQLWIRWYAIQFPNEDQRRVKMAAKKSTDHLPQVLTMGTNIATTFVILGVGIGISVLSFAVETGSTDISFCDSASKVILLWRRSQMLDSRVPWVRRVCSRLFGRAHWCSICDRISLQVLKLHRTEPEAPKFAESQLEPMESVRDFAESELDTGRLELEEEPNSLAQDVSESESEPEPELFGALGSFSH